MQKMQGANPAQLTTSITQTHFGVLMPVLLALFGESFGEKNITFKGICVVKPYKAL